MEVLCILVKNCEQNPFFPLVEARGNSSFYLCICRKPRGTPNRKGERSHEPQGTELKAERTALGDGVCPNDLSSTTVLSHTTCSYPVPLLLSVVLKSPANKYSLMLAVTWGKEGEPVSMLKGKCFWDKIHQSRDTVTRRKNMANSEAWSAADWKKM